MAGISARGERGSEGGSEHRLVLMHLVSNEHGPAVMQEHSVPLLVLTPFHSRAVVQMPGYRTHGLCSLTRRQML